ncbi:MAG: sugar kinase [Bauldia sp.]|nr:MAG: sugar kinase [Bauldia sp.]MBZ0229533.1 sugar kinase [Bauldia sp.]
MPSPDIISLGEPLFELNQPKGEEIFRQGHGGDTSNCAIAAARQGVGVGYVTAIGADQFGDSFMRLWADEGVDTSAVKRSQTAHTGLYFITHGPDGHVFSYMRAGSAASRMTPDDIPVDTIKGARILHASGISLAISSSAADAVFAAMRIARAAAVTVSFDTNLRLRLWPLDRARAVIHAAATLSDILRPGLDDARHLTGLADPDHILDFYLRLGPKIVALTLGADGAVVATRDRRERLPPVAVKLVDATGAGDMFDGAFLAEYLRTGDPFAAGRYANVAAALSTEGYGAVAPMPRRAAVEAAMKAGRG